MLEKEIGSVESSKHSTFRNAIVACLAAMSVAGAGCKYENGTREIVINQPDIVFPPAKASEIVVDSERDQMCRHMNEAETRWYEEMLRQDAKPVAQPTKE